MKIIAKQAILLLPWAIAPVVMAAEAPREDSTREISELVQQLGAEEFSARETATQRLMEIGLSAAPAMEIGLSDPDREIRFRCARILHAVKRLDFKKRLDAFAESEGQGDITLPGWERFRESIGSDGPARAVFVEMQRAESEIIDAAEKSPERGSQALTLRCQQLQEGIRMHRAQLNLGTIAAMLFIATNKKIVLPEAASAAVFGFCYQPSFQTAIDRGNGKEVVRRLLGQWVARSDGRNAYQALALSMRYDLQQGIEVAESTLTNGNQAYVVQYAMLMIAKLGTEKHLPLLESYLDDNTRTTTRRINNVSFETQIRDVALAALIHLAGEDPKKFGFSRLQRHQQVVFSTSTLGFKDDDERQAAFDKWKARPAVKGEKPKADDNSE